MLGRQVCTGRHAEPLLLDVLIQLAQKARSEVLTIVDAPVVVHVLLLGHLLFDLHGQGHTSGHSCLGRAGTLSSGAS